MRRPDTSMSSGIVVGRSPGEGWQHCADGGWQVDGFGEAVRIAGMATHIEFGVCPPSRACRPSGHRVSSSVDCWQSR
jgi:hypothetical protein